MSVCACLYFCVCLCVHVHVHLCISVFLCATVSVLRVFVCICVCVCVCTHGPNPCTFASSMAVPPVLPLRLSVGLWAEGWAPGSWAWGSEEGQQLVQATPWGVFGRKRRKIEVREAWGQGKNFLGRGDLGMFEAERRNIWKMLVIGARRRPVGGAGERGRAWTVDVSTAAVCLGPVATCPRLLTPPASMSMSPVSGDQQRRREKMLNTMLQAGSWSLPLTGSASPGTKTHQPPPEGLPGPWVCSLCHPYPHPLPHPRPHPLFIGENGGQARLVMAQSHTAGKQQN